MHGMGLLHATQQPPAFYLLKRLNNKLNTGSGLKETKSLTTKPNLDLC